MTLLSDLLPLTQDNADQAHEFVFAPWVKSLGLRDFQVEHGRVSAHLPANNQLQFFTGAMCGQAIMAAVDTVTSLAMMTTDRMSKGTVYQHTHFLRPAMNDDFTIEAEVLRFGKATAYAEAHVRLLSTRKAVAHAVLEFAF